ncbi:hypothetical protein C3B44_00385 [Corynebacterium yudongzhengii]|uniref:SWIM-type domain-containing protein n=1 Tax=Corynebacterium yudongzhengii TaxID=2080740 RepID=A0A2U1T473_9CORY|nr:hypothetical protein [Corynebacterium yudongzhengii]AWB80995.1 hypothetical protein C3B44_00385 [Corynebacterium yudongzhengii]PWC00783.1 hypothetical protein DF222_11010 [Corynebacterium yudongzhengii]
MPESLADQVLPLIRTKERDLWEYGRSNEQGRRMLEGLDILEEAAAQISKPHPPYPAEEVFDVAHRALNSAVRVLARADDSAGIIGDAVRGLLALHPQLAPHGRMKGAKLKDWFIKFHDGPGGYFFELDPVQYQESLGKNGLEKIREHFTGPEAEDNSRRVYFSQRFAVLDRDPEAILVTHLRDRKVPAWYEDAARVLAEIGEYDRAIEIAHDGYTHGGSPWQQDDCAQYYLTLVAEHQPERLREETFNVVTLLPTARTASQYLELVEDSEKDAARAEMEQVLAQHPRECALFRIEHRDDDLATLRYVDAHLNGEQDMREVLAERLFPTEPAIATQVFLDRIADRLVKAESKRYRPAARGFVKLIKRARKAEAPEALEVIDKFVAGLRQKYSNRPKLMQALDEQGL